MSQIELSHILDSVLTVEQGGILFLADVSFTWALVIPTTQTWNIHQTPLNRTFLQLVVFFFQLRSDVMADFDLHQAFFSPFLKEHALLISVHNYSNYYLIPIPWAQFKSPFQLCLKKKEDIWNSERQSDCELVKRQRGEEKVSSVSGHFILLLTAERWWLWMPNDGGLTWHETFQQSAIMTFSQKLSTVR